MNAKNSLFLAVFFFAVNALAWDYLQFDLPSNAKESLWRDALATAWTGKTEVVIEYGRIDVLTETSAVELDWPRKWHEGFGQALHYADVTGKQGVLALISDAQGPGNLTTSSLKRFNHVERTCNKHGIRLLVLFPTPPQPLKVADASKTLYQTD